MCVCILHFGVNSPHSVMIFHTDENLVSPQSTAFRELTEETCLVFEGEHGAFLCVIVQRSKVQNAFTPTGLKA